MKRVIRIGWLVLGTSFSIVMGAPRPNGALGKAYCAHRGYCARTSNSRISFVNPRPSYGFNDIDGNPSGDSSRNPSTRS